MIRTLAEVQSGNVTVKVTVDDEVSAPLTIDAVQPAVDRDEVERLTYRVAELEVELERYRRAHVCTVECKPNQHTAFQGRRQVSELEAELKVSKRDNIKLNEKVRELDHKVREYDRDRKTERDRADRAEQTLNEVTRQLAEVKEAVHNPYISTALRTTWLKGNPPWHMARAVRKVRRLTDSPQPIDFSSTGLVEKVRRASRVIDALAVLSEPDLNLAMRMDRSTSGIRMAEAIQEARKILYPPESFAEDTSQA